MDISQNICKSHKEPIQAICITKACQSRLACIKCIAKTHKECNSNFIFLSDLTNSDVSSLLEIDVVAKTIPRETITSLLGVEAEIDYKDKINSIFTEFTDEISKIINNFKAELLKELPDFEPTEKLKDEIQKVLKINELNSLISNYSSDEQFSSGLNQIDLVKNQETVIKNLKEYIYSLKSNLSYPHTILTLNTRLEACKTEFNKHLNPKLIFGPKIFIDTNMTSSLHEVSLDKTSLKHTGRNGSTGLSYLNFEMKPNTGIYRWKMSFGGLPGSGNSNNSSWYSVGIIDEANYGMKRDGAPYSSTICIGTDSDCYGGMKITHNEIRGQFVCKLLECEFDSRSAVFTVTSGTVFKASGQGKVGSAYRPVIFTWNNGNVCYLIE